LIRGPFWELFYLEVTYSISSLVPGGKFWMMGFFRDPGASYKTVGNRKRYYFPKKAL
jgi:hypothetical protein